MKILAIGDFHGKFPKRLQKKIKQIKPDLIVSPGDFCGNEELTRLFFKHVFAKDIELWEVIGKKRTKELELKSANAGIRVVKNLASFNIPIISITGNNDHDRYKQIGLYKSWSKWKFENKDLFMPKTKNFPNFKIINYKLTRFEELNFVGYPKSSYPGVIPGRKRKKEGSTYYRLKLEKRLRDQKLYCKLLERLFKKAKNPLIFLAHNVPYMTKLDKIADKKAHKLVKAEHYGDYITKQLIRKYNPLLCICGHMHENQGICKVGKTNVINAGSACKGKAALINIEGKRIKSIKFLR